MQVANTILQQLGGNKFAVMTGARTFIGSDDALSFRLPRAAKGINAVRVELQADDTYTMTFSRVRANNRRTISRFDQVYCDQLVSIFEQETSLVTRLF